MKALVCDDDASTRFMVRRLLEDNFGCGVSECGDGVELLEMMARTRFAFVLLDLEMPTMNGVETLEEMRHSDVARDTPVIIVSRQREEEAIARLLPLGIADYLLKPLRNDVALRKIEKLMEGLPRPAMEARELDRIRLAADTPALLVDGNLDYRYFFTSQVERYGRVVHAESGAAALSLCKTNFFPLIFVGSELGVVSGCRVAQKLRSRHPSGLRIVRIAGDDEAPPDLDLFDGSIARSYVPDTFRAAVRPYLFIPGAFTALSEVVPELPEITSSAATQVFGMMFDSEVRSSSETGVLPVGFSSTVEITLDGRFAIRLGVHLPRASAVAAASKMAGAPAEDVPDEDCLSVAGELGNIITGRVHARFGERQMKSVCGLPELTASESFEQPDEGNGLIQRFTMPGVGDFLISILVTDHVGGARVKTQAGGERNPATESEAEDVVPAEPTGVGAGAH